MIHCKECYLHKQSRHELIFTNFTEGRGNKNAKVMFVLDHILYSDVIEEQILSSTQYQELLEEYCKNAQIDYHDLYITSLIKCYPSDKNKKPTKPAIKKCEELYLEKELKEIKPKIVILCGSTSCKFFIDGFQNMKQVVGKSFYSNVYNCYFVPVYDLYYLTQLNPKSKPHWQMRQAFNKVQYLLNASKKEAKIKVYNDYSMLSKLGNIVGVDTETEGLNYLQDDILTIGISDLKTTLAFDYKFGKGILWNKIIPELKKRKLVIHNALFDLLMFKRKGYDLTDNIHCDSMLLQHLLNPTGGRSLGFLISMYYGVSYKDIVDRANIKDMNPKDRLIYCGEDSFWHLKLCADLIKGIKKQESTQSVKVFMNLIKVLVDLHYTGILIDPERLKELITFYTDLINKEETTFRKKAKITEEFNLNSPKQLSDLLFNQWGLPILRRSKQTKEPSCNKEVLNQLTDKKPILKHLIDLSEHEGMRRKLVKQYQAHVREDGKIHSTFDLFSPDSSRLMSKKPNIQNANRKGRLKEVFVAKEGHSFVYYDYAQLEFRVWVHLSQDETAIKFIQEGKDIHRFIASRFHKKIEEEITKEERNLTKIINFGSMYGLTPEDIALQHKVPLEHAKQIQRIFFNICKKGYFWLQELEQEAERNKYVKTPFGTYRFFPDIDMTFDPRKKKKMLDEAKNFPIQSWAVELVFIGMYKIHQQLRQRGLDAHFVHQIHDACILEVKDEKVDEVVKIIEEYGQNPMQLSIPLTVEIKTGKRWSDVA